MPGAKGEAGPTGQQGIQGLQGATGPVAAILPFSISKYGVTLSTDDQGEPLGIAFSGFGSGYHSASYLQEGEWSTGLFTVHEEMGYPTAFIMPSSGVLKKIYVLFSTEYDVSFEEGSIIQPFVCIAISDSNGLEYRILSNTIVLTDPYEGGQYPRHAVRRGSLLNLSENLAEGTLVAIVTGFSAQNVTGQQSGTFSINGGIYIE